MPLCAGVALLLATTRPAIGRGRAGLLDWSLVASLVVIAGQLVPIPVRPRELLSPHAFAVDHVVALDIDPAIRAAHALSVDVESTVWALALAGTYIGLFWYARATFSRGGLRTTVRGVAWLGLALTVLVAVQRATSPALLYWYWRPLSEGASPYGPFVNRNGLATWLAMAVPLLVGYAMARYQSQQLVDHGAAGAGVDARQLLLGGAAVLMTGCLLATLSRAGIFGAAIGLTFFVGVSRKRIGARVAWIAGGFASMAVLASAYANLGKLAMRLQETTEQGQWGRAAIWHDTWRIVSDFWLTGVGAGAFQRAMLVYQEGSRLFFFNHAHDEYLQLLAEGGLLIAVPATIALVAAAALMAHRLRTDHTAIFWVRAGAISGMVAAAVQGIWDTGLRTPANGVLFAVIAAAALHSPRQVPVRTHAHTTSR